jgi:hypothetical protein
MSLEEIPGLHIFHEPLLTPAEVTSIISQIDSIRSRHKVASETRHFNAKLRKSYLNHYSLFRNLVRILDQEALRVVLAKYLEHPVIDHIDLLVKDAAGPETFFHQDRPYWVNFDNPPSMRTLWLPLVDVAVENGCLRVAPGKPQEVLPHAPREHSANSGQLVIEEKVEAELKRSAVDVPLRAGAAMMFDSFVIHGAHPNKVDRPRYAFKIVFGDAGSMKAGRGYKAHGKRWEASRKLGHLPFFLRMSSDRVLLAGKNLLKRAG